ncbi:MAG: PHP domain-containing protein [Chloroflexota bacterium]
MHTTASDGVLSPSALVQLARTRKIDIIAITDHDTTGGLIEAQAAANGMPIIIPAIELSAEHEGADVDILGYCIDPANTIFQNRLALSRRNRITRAEAMVEKLADLGVPIRMERVLELANGGSVCRPHIARALVEAGHVEGLRDAFERYLGSGAPAYIPGDKLSLQEAIDLIHTAGGVAILAHPALVPDYLALIELMLPLGLDGVEVAHPKNPNPVRANLRGIAKKHNLIMTGGSDFHRPEADLLGSMTPPPGCVQALQARAEKYR